MQIVLKRQMQAERVGPEIRVMNGKISPVPARQIKIPKPTQVVQVMSDKEIAEKRNPDLRLPRQAEHYSQIVGHFLAVKNSPEIAVAIQAHFQRLEKYHRQLLGIPTDDVEAECLDPPATWRSAASAMSPRGTNPSRLRGVAYSPTLRQRGAGA